MEHYAGRSPTSLLDTRNPGGAFLHCLGMHLSPRRPFHALVLFTLACLAACSGASSSSVSSSSGATPTGGGCASADTCSGGICAQSADFPSGYCTQGCSPSDPSSCPAGSVCIDDASGAPPEAGVKSLCYQSCQTAADCTRAGYSCLEKANHLVCRNSQ